MKKEYIAFYENDLLEYYPKNKQLDDYKFESRIIDDEMWFVMLSDEDIRYPASVVFANDDWIVIDKNVLHYSKDTCWVFKYNPYRITAEELENISKLLSENFPEQKFVFVQDSFNISENEYKRLANVFYIKKD